MNFIICTKGSSQCEYTIVGAVFPVPDIVSHDNYELCIIDTSDDVPPDNVQAAGSEDTAQGIIVILKTITLCTYSIR